MPIQVPKNCSSRDCRDTAIEPIHTASRRLDIDTVDGRPVFAHHVTYRCIECGHTWAVQGTSTMDLHPILYGAEAAPEPQHGYTRGW